MTREQELPKWAEGRPAQVVAALLLRRQRALDMRPGYCALGEPNSGHYCVRKSDDTLDIMRRTAILTHTVEPGTSLEVYKATLNVEEFYIVDIKNGTCSCPDCALNGMICKHIFTIIEDTNNSWAFDHLPKSLTAQPHLVIDYQCCPEIA